MFATSGFFRGLNCPHYARGQGRTCRRPYCHFRHVRRDTDEGNSSTSAAVDVGKKTAENQSSNIKDGASKLSDYVSRLSTALPPRKKKSKKPPRGTSTLSAGYVPTPPLLQKKTVPPTKCVFDNPFGQTDVEAEEYDPTNASLGSTSQKYSLDSGDQVHEEYSPLGGQYDPLQNSDVEQVSRNKYTPEPEARGSMEYNPVDLGGAVNVDNAETPTAKKYSIDEGPATDLEYDPLVNSSLEAVQAKKYPESGEKQESHEEYDPMEVKSSKVVVNSSKYKPSETDISTLYGVDQYDPLDTVKSISGNVVDYTPTNKYSYSPTPAAESVQYIPTANYSPTPTASYSTTTTASNYGEVGEGVHEISPQKRKASTDISAEYVKKLKQCKETGDDEDLHNWEMDAWFSEDDDEDVRHANKRRAHGDGRRRHRNRRRVEVEDSDEDDEPLIIDIYDDLPFVKKEKSKSENDNIIEIDDDDNDEQGTESSGIQSKEGHYNDLDEKEEDKDEDGELLIIAEDDTTHLSDPKQNNETNTEKLKEPEPTAKTRVSSEQLADFFIKRLQQPPKPKMKRKRANSLNGGSIFKSSSTIKGKIGDLESKKLTEQNSEKLTNEIVTAEIGEKSTAESEKISIEKSCKQSTAEIGKKSNAENGKKSTEQIGKNSTSGIVEKSNAENGKVSTEKCGKQLTVEIGKKSIAENGKKSTMQDGKRKSTEQSGKKSTEHSVKKSTAEIIKKSMTEGKTKSTSEKDKKSTTESGKKSIEQSGNKSTVLDDNKKPKQQTNKKSIEQSGKKSTVQSGNKSTEKTDIDSSKESGKKSTEQNGPSTTVEDDNIFSKLLKSTSKDTSSNKSKDEILMDGTITSTGETQNKMPTNKDRSKEDMIKSKERNISKITVSKSSGHKSNERRRSSDKTKKDTRDTTSGVETPQTSNGSKSKTDSKRSSSKEKVLNKQISSEKETANMNKDKSKANMQLKTSEKITSKKDGSVISSTQSKSISKSSKQESGKDKVASSKQKPSDKPALQRSNSSKTKESSNHKTSAKSKSAVGKSHASKERNRVVSVHVDLFGSLSSESSDEPFSSTKKKLSLMKVPDSTKALTKKVAHDVFELSSTGDEMFHISQKVQEDLQKCDDKIEVSKNVQIDKNSEAQASSKDVYDLSSDSSDVDSSQRRQKVEALKKRYAEMMRKVEEQEKEAAEMRRAAEAQLKQCETITRKRKSTSDSSGRHSISSSASSTRRFSEQELFGGSSEDEARGDEAEKDEVVIVKETSKDDIKHEIIDLLSSDESGDELKTTKKSKEIDLKTKIGKNFVSSDGKRTSKKLSNKIDVKHRNEKNDHHKHSGTKTSSSHKHSGYKTSSSTKSDKSSKSSSGEGTSSKSKELLKKTNSEGKKSSSKDKKGEHKSGNHKPSSVCEKSKSSKDKTKESSKVCDKTANRKSSSSKERTKERTKERSKVCDKTGKKLSSKDKVSVYDKSSNQKSSSSKDKTKTSGSKSAIEISKRKRRNSEMCVNSGDDGGGMDDYSDVENHALSDHALSDAEIPDDVHMTDMDISFSETDTYDECLKIFNEETVPLKEKETPPDPDELEDLPAINVGKKRVAHAPKFDTRRMRKVPKKPRAQPSPAQICHNRYFMAQQEALENMPHDPPPQRVPEPVTTRPSTEKKRVAHTPKGPLASRASSTSSPSRRVSNFTPSSSSSSASYVSPKQRIIDKKYSTVNRANSGWEIAGTTLATTADKGGRRMAHVPTKVSPRPAIPIGHGGKIPSVVRQRYLNLFIDEFLKTCETEEEAFDFALKEEQTIHDRANTKPIYLNLSINYLKKLRTATADPTAPVPSSPPPKNAVSHSAVIGGKGAVLHSYTIHRSASKTVDQGVLQGKNLYEKLQPYILTTEQLWDNGFPRSGDIPGLAEVKEDERKQKTLTTTDRQTEVKEDGRKQKTLTTTDPNQKVCCRCGKTFLRRPDGGYITKESCNFHWGKLWRQKVRGAFEHRFNCCSGDTETKGCCEAKLHVTEDKTTNMSGYMKTYTKTPPRDGYQGVYALDCEMCYTVKGMELTRVTVIDDKLKQVYDSLVKPDNEVVDHNTRFSGITEHDLKSVDTKLQNVQAVLLNMFSTETILIGHSLESDLLSLKMIHNNVVDTSVVFPHKLGPPFKRALKTLMAEFMKKLIQQDVGGHDSMEDAKSCMELMVWKLKEDAKSKR